jgi:branched-chain amino acid transport system permease protein
MPALSTAALAAAAVAAAAAAPWLVSAYGLTVLIGIMTYVVLATAWVLFSGPIGLVSLATSAFFGVGAYSVAILVDVLPPYAVFVVALGAGALVALAVAVATLRLSGMYFVVFGFGLSELIRQLVTWWEITQTRTVGRYILVTTSDTRIYEQLVVLAVVVFAGGFVLRRSRLGFAARIVGSDETVARQVGLDASAVKVVMFVLSAVLITAAGAITAPRFAYISPALAFDPILSFEVVIMAFLGGLRRLWGPALGVVPLVALSQFLSITFPYLLSVILGLIFIGVVLAMPDGLAGLVEAAVVRLRTVSTIWRGARS